MYIGTDMGVSINGSANVTSADIEASNGVIHAIDAVLLPPTVVDLAVQNGNLGTLVPAVVGAGLAETLCDDAFAALGENVPNDLTPILQYHVVSGNVLSNDLSDGDVNTLNGTIRGALSESVTINESSEVIAINIQGTNGVVHLINKVLLPEYGAKKYLKLTVSRFALVRLVAL